MIRLLSQLVLEPKVNIRGGSGTGWSADYLQSGEMDGIQAAGRTCLEPGAGVGEHPHPDTFELYLILEGHGTGIVDGTRFPVGPGDLFVIKPGQSHGLDNTSDAPLSFLGVLTRQEGARP